MATVTISRKVPFLHMVGCYFVILAILEVLSDTYIFMNYHLIVLVST